MSTIGYNPIMGQPRKNYEEAVSMYDQGLSISDVASFFGISRQAMHKILIRRGVTFRTQTRLGKDNHFWRGGTRRPSRVGSIMTQAGKKGIIHPMPCEVCGSFGKSPDGRWLVHAHHDDYNKPLEVRWLCKTHHHEWHKKNKAIPLVGEYKMANRKDIASMGGKACWSKLTELQKAEKLKKLHDGNKK